MTPATRHQHLTFALIGAILSMGLVARVDAFTVWVMMVTVGFGSWVVLLRSWFATARIARVRLHEAPQPTFDVRGLHRRAAASTVSVSEWRRRRQARNLGWMSDRWLAEHRAAHR
jgi:hypothetical protein